MRQAYAGLLWSKQFYHYIVKDWLESHDVPYDHIALGTKPSCDVFVDDHGLLPPIPALHEHYSFKPWHGPIPLSLMYMANGLPDGVKPEFKKEHYEVDFRDIPPFEEEPLAPPEDLIKRQITYFYALGNMTNDEYWKKINEGFSKSIEDFMKERPAILTAFFTTAMLMATASSATIWSTFLQV